MIVAGTSPLLHINLDKDEPGMVLQYLGRGVWRDYLVDGEPVLSPVDIDVLPFVVYRLV